jgi:hypothetical protein
MWGLKRMIDSHQGWDWNNPAPMGGNRHVIEIRDLWRAYARCQSLYEQKCRKECPAPDPKSILTGFGILGLGIGCALAPQVCIPGLAIGGTVLAPTQ